MSFLGDVSCRYRAQIKQLAWPMAERQIRHRKSSLVLSAQFPVVNDVPVLLLNKPSIFKETNFLIIILPFGIL